ncbi:winged helix-turn-helix domain-containing protein [Pseudoalteromonas sp. C2R02]|uniref:winged helix-turn-helix domain-containing protein n=1 Tax=Pseudoalteromonas sp. C2R02 TaxID=2841565 RepID=UPI001C085799|nr:winged helix-turn-helix domain-containing protein [Pseudoalteromonas sp. C2R02]MBU2968277.1 winged helix-turn-helix domain-containing protein [Pseudoalteromonas sp. C2R02]
MQHIFKTGDWKVDTLSLSLYKLDQKIEIRPKTFSLLCIFLNNPRQVILKQTILETVWDDVLVNDQVLFQTIRELRNIFEGSEVIKTVPRKGYCWLLNVEKIEEKITIATKPVENSATPTKRPSSRTELKKYLPTFLVSVFLVIALVIVYFKNDSKDIEMKGSLLVLPVQNKIIGNDHDWVSFGAMDQLINTLKSNDSIAVADLNYVMSSMKLANINISDLHNINRIFEVSGAVIVVGSELSGSVEEYRLAYSLYFKNDIKRGVLFSRTVTGVLDQLASQIASYTHQQIVSSQDMSHDEFNSELIARAIEQINNNNFKLASELLSSLIQIQPKNIIAHRLLAESYMALSNFNLAIETLNNVLPLAIESQSSELTRLYFFLALSSFNHSLKSGEINLRIDELIDKANAYADNQSDWLYKAYIAELIAVKENSKNNTEMAIKAASKALEYFNIIRCPIGNSRMESFLYGLYKKQGNQLKSTFHKENAQKIIKQRDITLVD